MPERIVEQPAYDRMKYTIEIPDEEVDFVLQVIRRLSSAIKLTPGKSARAVKPQDETEYLLSTEANAARLLESIAELERGEGRSITLG